MEDGFSISFIFKTDVCDLSIYICKFAGMIIIKYLFHEIGVSLINV